MTHLNQSEKTFRINPRSVFSFKDLPSCLYRVAYFLTNNPYISAETFYRELSFRESLQLYQMVQVIAAEYSGNFKPSNPTEEYMLQLARISVMKCTELLCYGTGDSDLSPDVFMEKLETCASMISVHFLNVNGSVQANYEKFDINCKDHINFVKIPPTEPEGAT